ncbi:MAG: hypothetical protein P4L46_00830 [Fimbriimonas sp.]|nr:hypothetical protein [Fimbriimonas sp.]
MVKTRGDIYEGIAFQFCKVATVAVIAGRFTLPIAAGLCAAFYVAAIVHGKTETRCWARKPWLIASFWTVVCGAWLVFSVHPIRWP